MANKILIKRGLQADISNLTLEEGELALAYNADKTAVALYAGGNNGETILVNPDVSGDISGVLANAKSYADGKINDLVNGAPEAMDTLKELADAIAANSDVMDALNSAIGGKVDKADGKGLSTEDFTTEEKAKLAGLSNFTHPATHPADMITQDASHRFVSDTEKNTWNSKLGADDTIDGGTF